MTGNTGVAPGGAFDKSLLACMDDINKLLPELSQRYETTVILSALAEHVGSALQVLMLRKICDARQAQQVIKNIESCAFLKKPPDLRIVAAPPEGTDTPQSDDPKDTGEKT